MSREEHGGWRLIRDVDAPASEDDLASIADLLREIATLLRRLDSAKPLLTVDDLAGWLGITPRAVRRLLDHEDIPSARLGRRRVILREQFLAHLAEKARRRSWRSAVGGS